MATYPHSHTQNDRVSKPGILGQDLASFTSEINVYRILESRRDENTYETASSAAMYSILSLLRSFSTVFFKKKKKGAAIFRFGAPSFRVAALELSVKEEQRDYELLFG